MKTLVLQMGHVPRRRGATGGPGEQALARRVAAEVRKLMPHAGWQVRVIEADEPASRYRGDAFVALHGDAHGSSSAGGASVGYRTSEGRALAARWKQAYGRHWPYSWRSDNYTAALAGYYGHRHAVGQGNRPAIIVEHGFMTNPTERRWIDSPEGTRAAALAVVEAVTGSVPGEEFIVRKEDEATIREIVRQEAGRAVAMYRLPDNSSNDGLDGQTLQTAWRATHRHARTGDNHHRRVRRTVRAIGYKLGLTKDEIDA